MTSPRTSQSPANLSELMRRVTVTATSPDGSVTATYTASDGIRVGIDQRGLTHHSDTSLSEALTAAVRRAVNGVQHAHEQLRELRNGTPPRRASTQAAPRSPSGSNIKQYSPRHYVFVVLSGTRQPTVHLRPRTISALHDAATIADEVNAALTAAYQGAARQRIRHV